MDDDIKDFEALCTAIGFVVVNWAMAEQSLDVIVSNIYDNCGGSTLEKDKPWNLKRKIRFLRLAFAQFVALQPYAEQGIKILDTLDTLSKKRHDLVHGVVTSITPENGIFQFERLDYRNKVLETIPFDAKEFPKLAQDLLDLGKTITRFGYALEQRFQS